MQRAGWGSNAEKLGVDVRLNCAATVESILSENPDVVVVATGARPLTPEVPGVERAIDAWSVLNGDLPKGERIAVIDEEYGFQGTQCCGVTA